MADDIAKLDLYDILGVGPEASEKEILKAYRKKALKCHPDKNPDNPKAGEEFLKLSKALEVLTDAAAKAAYDKVLQAKKAAELRHRALDSKRKKLKEDLEAREAAAEKLKEEQKIYSSKNLQAEIERLRKEGSKLVQEEQQRMKEELEKESKIKPVVESPGGARLKLKWKAKKTDSTNGGYSKEYLYKILDKYGDMSALIVSTTKNGSAIVEFESQHAALLAVQNELGIPSNPLSFTWISGQPADPVPTKIPSPSRPSDTTGFASFDFTTTGVSGFSFNSQPSSNSSAGDAKKDAAFDDFEDLVMRKMRQAEERKLLEQQIEEDDNKNEKT